MCDVASQNHDETAASLTYKSLTQKIDFPGAWNCSPVSTSGTFAGYDIAGTISYDEEQLGYLLIDNAYDRFGVVVIPNRRQQFKNRIIISEQVTGDHVAAAHAETIESRLADYIETAQKNSGE